MASRDCLTRLVTKPYDNCITITVAEPLGMLSSTNILIITQLLPFTPKYNSPPYLLSARPTYVVMRLVSALLPLSVLGIVRVGKLPLTPAHTPVINVASVLSSIPVTLVSTPVTLAVAVIVDISIGAALSMTSTYTLLAVPPGLS